MQLAVNAPPPGDIPILLIWADTPHYSCSGKVYLVIIEPFRDEIPHEVIKKENKQDANETRQRFSITMILDVPRRVITFEGVAKVFHAITTHMQIRAMQLAEPQPKFQ